MRNSVATISGASLAASKAGKAVGRFCTSHPVPGGICGAATVTLGLWCNDVIIKNMLEKTLNITVFLSTYFLAVFFAHFSGLTIGMNFALILIPMFLIWAYLTELTPNAVRWLSPRYSYRTALVAAGCIALPATVAQAL